MFLVPTALKRIASHRLIYLIEQLIIAGAMAAVILVFQLVTHRSMGVRDASMHLIINFIIGSISSFIFGTHRGIIRFSEIHDISTVLLHAIVSLGLWIFCSVTMGSYLFDSPLPYSLLIFNASLSASFLIGFRVMIREIYFRTLRSNKSTHNLIIYGAGDLGMTTVKAMTMDNKNKNRVVCFIDDEPQKLKKQIGGITVESAEINHVGELIKKNNIQEIVLAANNLDTQRKLDLAAKCVSMGVKLSQIPPLSEWMDGVFRSEQLKAVTIEMLLQRPVIRVFNEKTAEEMQDATILITGAAGSIGSEICRQLSVYQLKQMIVLDQSETGLFDLINELKQHHPNLSVAPALASVRDQDAVDKIMTRYQPKIVFHAAAYKHVPMLEAFPDELVKTNILGTRIVAESALRHGVQKFVMISTDKAVNPTNLMGASKRVAELYVQQLNSDGRMKCITTRFGNVLGSNGSVVPTFRRQIEMGGPITVTHPEITRYFMTIPEASQLVLEAATMGEGKEIFVFDMGEPVKILDLANRMIMLAGLVPDKDIEVQFTGLRPGEKLYEELFRENENLLPTHHPKIMRAKYAESSTGFGEKLNRLLTTCQSANNQESEIREVISELVPEYGIPA